MLLWKPGNQRRDLKPQKLNHELCALFQTPRERGKDDAGVGIQRLKGTHFALVFSPLQLKSTRGSFEEGEAWEMQRGSIHSNSREGKETQEIPVFPHQLEELTGISGFLSFPTRSLLRHHHALEDPQNPEHRHWCLSRRGHAPRQQSSCNLSFTWMKLENSLISSSILTPFTSTSGRVRRDLLSTCSPSTRGGSAKPTLLSWVPLLSPGPWLSSSILSPHQEGQNRAAETVPNPAGVK